jgi:hypothetical protein
MFLLLGKVERIRRVKGRRMVSDLLFRLETSVSTPSLTGDFAAVTAAERIPVNAAKTASSQRKKAAGKVPYRLFETTNPLVVTGRFGRAPHQRDVAFSSSRNYRFPLKLPEEWQLEG